MREALAARVGVAPQDVPWRVALSLTHLREVGQLLPDALDDVDLDAAHLTADLVQMAARYVGQGLPAAVADGNVVSVAASCGRLNPAVAQRVAALLTDPRWAGAWTDGDGFRRTSCCLIYQVAGGPAAADALCGDCVLA